MDNIIDALLIDDVANSDKRGFKERFAVKDDDDDDVVVSSDGDGSNEKLRLETVCSWKYDCNASVDTASLIFAHEAYNVPVVVIVVVVIAVLVPCIAVEDDDDDDVFEGIVDDIAAQDWS